MINDDRALHLLGHVIDSFHVEGSCGKGAPIGNLTSQIFTNIYLNDFDQYVKHSLRVKHYLRFADDCLLLAPHRQELEELLPKIEEFLALRLKLALHPDKVSIRPLNHGIDFLGIVVHPFHRTLRTTTKRRMLRKLTERHGEAFRGEIDSDSLHQSLQSYLGILSHVDARKSAANLRHRFCFLSYDG